MNEDKIKRLIKILEESDIGEIELSSWGRKIRVSKGSLNSNGVADSNVVKVVSGQEEAASVSIDSTPDEQSANENHIQIKSPMVGTFYTASTPEAEPFVKVGDKVKEGDVLCIVEAMKLMNEIESEYSGVIIEILVDNSKPVQYNEPLFLIDVG
ncbi:MAG: acetyl-CoA carboxylase biotin carboxyl carrier protein [Candidatus Marinimicrobia bacterium]|nr:acetyl-CoA carboxylase biotin carboxyl carrier protein [Candidatus Neomarinimicrobiota bacterium]